MEKRGFAKSKKPSKAAPAKATVQPKAKKK
jgi:hypothetical protein